MMIVAAARALHAARTVFVGVGLPNVACNLALRTTAPDLQLIYESGVYGARPARQPLSIGDPALVSGALSVVSMPDLFGLYLQGGLIDVALLGGAQIDRFGNLNTTVIGDYSRPRVRLPGSGGACEIAINARRLVYIMRLSRRAFVPKLDFCTSPGHLSGGESRAEAGMYGEGPVAVITDLAVFDFNNPEREMQLSGLHAGATVEKVQEEVGWDLRVSGTLHETPPPTAQELDLLRNELDPESHYR
ncbi:MAG: CoA-transferase subunit beta [Chloroflexota bacterium]|nr:CoA-transferase subunit beta [Chloroflexota bacterium]